MYYSSGNYEAFATPKKPEGVDHKSAYIIGSGLAAVAALMYCATYPRVTNDMGSMMGMKAFIAAVKKYTDLQELDAAVLRAFIDRIEVSHVDKKSRTREITIVYNFIGAFDFTRAIENARNISKKEQRTA